MALEIRNQFLNWSGTWWFTVSLVVNHAIGPLIGLIVWSAVLPGETATMNYYVALVGVFLLTASFENYTFSESVYDGSVSHELLKPQPVIVRPAGENLAIRLWLAIFGLPLTAVTALVAGALYQLRSLLLALPVLLFAAVLRFLWTWLLALTAFWTERVHAIVGFSDILIFLLGGTAAPVAQLPDPWPSAAQALPFHAMLGLPAEIATGTPDSSALGDALLQQACWGALFATASAIVWRSGIRRYTVVGA